MIYIETPRLILRDWKEEDLRHFRELNSDERVMRYFPGTLSQQQTDSFYDGIQKEFREYHYGLYAVEVKENKEFIGFIGFHRAAFEAEFTPCVEIGWRLKKDSWGNGYATEGAKACLEYGLKKFDFQEVFSFTSKINIPSQRVMEKIGLRYVKEFDHPKLDRDSDLCKHVLYSIKITK